MSVSLRRKNRLFKNMLKRICPSTDPCCVPSIISVQELKAISVFALCQRLVKQGGLNKKEMQLNICNNFSILIFNVFYIFAY